MGFILCLALLLVSVLGGCGSGGGGGGTDTSTSGTSNDPVTVTPSGNFPIGRWEGPHGASFTVTNHKRSTTGLDYYAGSITYPAFGTIEVAGVEMETSQIIMGLDFVVNANVARDSGSTFFIFKSSETDTTQTFPFIWGTLIVTSTSGPSYNEDVVFVRK